MRTRYERREAELDATREALDATRAEHERTLQEARVGWVSERQTLLAEAEGLRAGLRDAQAALEDLRSATGTQQEHLCQELAMARGAAQRAEGEAASLRAEREEARGQLADLLTQREGLLAQARGLEDAARAAEGRSQQLEEQHRAGQCELHRIKGVCDDLARRGERREAELDATREALDATRAEHERTLQEARVGWVSERQTLLAEAEGLRAGLRDAQAALEDLRSATGTQQEHLCQELAMARGAAQRAEGEAASLRAEREEARGQLADLLTQREGLLAQARGLEDAARAAEARALSEAERRRLALARLRRFLAELRRIRGRLAADGPVLRDAPVSHQGVMLGQHDTRHTRVEDGIRGQATHTAEPSQQATDRAAEPDEPFLRSEALASDRHRPPKRDPHLAPPAESAVHDSSAALDRSIALCAEESTESYQAVDRSVEPADLVADVWVDPQQNRNEHATLTQAEGETRELVPRCLAQSLPHMETIETARPRTGRDPSPLTGMAVSAAGSHEQSTTDPEPSATVRPTEAGTRIDLRGRSNPTHDESLDLTRDSAELHRDAVLELWDVAGGVRPARVADIGNVPTPPPNSWIEEDAGIAATGDEQESWRARVVSGVPSLTDLNAEVERLRTAGRMTECVQAARVLADSTQARLGENHPQLADSLVRLASVLRDQGVLGEAELLLRRSVSIYRVALGDGHPKFAASLNELATLLADAGEVDEAQSLLEWATSLSHTVLGADHGVTVGIRENLDTLLRVRAACAADVPAVVEG